MLDDDSSLGTQTSGLRPGDDAPSVGGRSLSSTPVAINNGPLSLRIAILLRLYRADAGKLLGVDYQTDRLH